jgi:hypothetical protein
MNFQGYSSIPVLLDKWSSHSQNKCDCLDASICNRHAFQIQKHSDPNNTKHQSISNLQAIRISKAIIKVFAQSAYQRITNLRIVT